MAQTTADPHRPDPALTGLGARAHERLKTLARLSEPGPGVTRFPYTPEHRAALDLLTEWMTEAGLTVSLDAAGTLIGRREGPPGSKTLLLGSHQDTVRSGGAYDGALGVVLPICAMAALKDAPLPFAVEILAFADEEGVRFTSALIGPRALAGTFDASHLAMTDRGGAVRADVMRDFGLDVDAIAGLRRDPAQILGYVETHIEQGPALEAADQPLGIVTGICGIERWSARLTGVTGHAGTTPMDLRRDALCGAAEIALAVERRARETEDLVGTVGAFDIAPNVANGIPDQADFTIELRSPVDSIRAAAGEALAVEARAIAERRGLTLEIERIYEQVATPCDPALSDLLEAAAPGAPRLASGATHDASAMADLCPVAMLFVRCRAGISHHPDEDATPEDIDAAGAALIRLLRSIA